MLCCKFGRVQSHCSLSVNRLLVSQRSLLPEEGGGRGEGAFSKSSFLDLQWQRSARGRDTSFWKSRSTTTQFIARHKIPRSSPISFVAQQQISDRQPMEGQLNATNGSTLRQEASSCCYLAELARGENVTTPTTWMCKGTEGLSDHAIFQILFVGSLAHWYA